jgi:hypothetical protein
MRRSGINKKSEFNLSRGALHAVAQTRSPRTFLFSRFNFQSAVPPFRRESRRILSEAEPVNPCAEDFLLALSSSRSPNQRGEKKVREFHGKCNPRIAEHFGSSATADRAIVK